MRQQRAIPLIAALAILAVRAALLPAAEPAPPTKVATIEGITEYRLDNGLRILSLPDPSRAKVTVNLTVLVGSRHEGYGETGMAHLLEHMVFKGTPTHAHIPRALQERGAQFNGTTNSDRTNYFETMPASDSNLEFAIGLEADRLVNSLIRREDLASEMTVVRNEFEMGENSPQGVLMQKVLAAAYEWHNYGKSTIGNRSDIERVPIENLRAFYRKFYQPDNAVLVLAGRFAEAKALQYVAKYFGAIPRPQRKLDTTYTDEPPQDGERTVVLRRVGDTAVVGVAYHVPAGPHPDFAAVQVAANVLTSQPSGRLYKALVETRKAASVFGSAQPLHDPGVLEIVAQVGREQSVDEVRDTLLKLVEEAASQGVTNEEVRRAKQQILKQRELAREDTSQLAVGISNWAAQGDWRLYFLNRDRIEAVTADQVKAVAGTYLRRNNRTVGLFLPTTQPERVAVASTPNVEDMVRTYKGRATVAAGEAFDASPANLEARTRVTTLPEGLKVAVLSKKTSGEAVHGVLTLRYGNEENLKGFEAAAGFLPALMMRGTKKLSHQQLQDELDRLQARLGTGGGGMRGGRRGGGGGEGALGSVTFSLQAKRQTLPAVLGLLQQVLREPALSEDEFEVLKRERLAMVQRVRSEPQVLAMRQLQRQLSPYPRSDIRYVPTIEEDIERIQAVTAEQVRRLYQEFVGAQAGEFVLVGDCDSDEAVRIVGEAVAGWKAAQPYARIAASIPAEIPGGKSSIRTPDKANAVYAAGLVLPMMDTDPDYPALVLADYIFGASTLSSRLGDRVRQQEGLSYGVRSSFAASPFDRRAVLSISGICNPRNMARMEKAIREEAERLAEKGVTADELQRARAGYLQQRQVGRTTDTALCGLLGETLHRGRPIGYLAELEKKIAALTPEEVSAAFRKHVDPARLVVVEAGDFAAADGGNCR
jgi:zinc protease